MGFAAGAAETVGKGGETHAWESLVPVKKFFADMMNPDTN